MRSIAKHLIASIFCIIGIQLYAKDFTGFFNFSYTESSGKITLKIKEFDKEFLLVSYYASGLGSNDIGFDRGKIASQRLVQFKRFGNRVALIESNPFYKAVTDNVKEKKVAQDAFASAILFTFIIENENDGVQIDITPLITEDLNNTVQNLKDQKQGNYKIDKTKSIVIPEEMHAFPKNIEFEAWMTIVGESSGEYIKSVAPTPEIVSLRQHLSFVELPDLNYKPRVYHPYSGYFAMSYFDYATPINQPIEKRLIYRHRLEKKNQLADKSEAIAPIIYYMDPGCPEPIKSALIEGASWWNQAFEQAGYINGFQVKELPEGAHPLDVRYNTIQWVHRSTRGWSYGSNIHDPRTGEIIKGHVTLGSLRVRQDFMLAQGLLSLYEGNFRDDSPMVNMALARLKQLAAHEVGHTLGLAHNFAASYNERASVMDYPHPYAEIDDLGKINLDNAYDDKIGLWDKRAIIYGYKTFKIDESKNLNDLINDTKKMGLKFLSDPDARPDGSAAADAHLWDNGRDPIEELDRVLKVRNGAIKNFGMNSIPTGTPLSELEKILVPLYHAPRYQVEAVSKLIGGYFYEYSIKGDSVLTPFTSVDFTKQILAIKSILNTISPENLLVPENIKQLLLPNAYGYDFSQESFKNETGFGFDQIAAANASIDHVLNLMFHPQRLSRINNQRLMPLTDYFDAIYKTINLHPKDPLLLSKLSTMRQRNFVQRLIGLAQNTSKPELASAAFNYLLKIKTNLPSPKLGQKKEEAILQEHYQYISYLISKLEKHETVELPPIYFLPPGAPIGCE